MRRGSRAPLLPLALDGGQWSASRSDRFTSGERAPGTHWIGGWVDPRTGVDEVEKILDLTGTQNSDPSVVQLVASHYTDCANPAHIYMCTVTYEIFKEVTKMKDYDHTNLSVQTQLLYAGLISHSRYMPNSSRPP
jgi:hypothetical protein